MSHKTIGVLPSSHHRRYSSAASVDQEEEGASTAVERVHHMGQFHGAIMTTTRVAYDEKDNNGLVVCDRYVPAELLAEIFCRTDYRVLLNCQLVCKRWRMLIQSYIWRKKAEMTLGKPFPRDKDIPWDTFYLICKKRPFERNLLRNHSGQHGKKYWQILSQGGDCWKIESPPVGVPELPLTEPVFEGKQTCFVTSYYSCTKKQQVDLLEEGFTPYVLDNLQPPIEVSEWYSCRWDCPAVYECQIELLGEKNGETKVLDTFQLRDDIEGEKQNQWLRVSHVFENYGFGLRKISFYHGGMDKSFWSGHYGSKMAGACICVKIPPIRYVFDDEMDTLPIADE